MRVGPSFQQVRRSTVCWATAWLGLILVSACASEAPPLTQAAVPWIDRPGVPLTQLASSVVANRPCMARDIHVDVGPVGAYQGHQTQELRIRSVAPDACLIAAPPAIAVGFASGRQLAVTRDASMSVLGASNGIDGLAAGGSIRVLIGTPGACAGAGSSPNVANIVKLDLSATEVVTVSGTWINVECGSPVVLAFNLEQAAMPTVPASSLHAKLTVPAPTSPDGILTYFVTLSNPLGQAVMLVPCPSYTQSLGVGVPVRQTLALNCAAAGSIPAGNSVMFEMQLAVPANFPQGMTKLGWQLEVPGGASAGTTVAVG